MREAEIAVAPVGSELIGEMDNLISKYASKHPLSQDFCRVVALYALSRSGRDRNDFALQYVDNWIDFLEVGSTEHKVGLVFLCNALMAMGEYEECRETSKRVMVLAEKEPTGYQTLVANLNHAYYLSEAYYHRAFDEPTGAGVRDREETDTCGREALKIALELKSAAEKADRKNQLLDTVGAVLITCGQNEEQVREGLELCRAVLASSADSPGYELMKNFFALHERRAFKRLADFD